MAATRKTSIRDRHRAAIRATGAPCALCGKPIDYSLPYLHPKAFVVDHIVPLVRGGDDVLENKQAAHNDCNRAKAARRIPPTLRRSGSLRRDA